MKRQLGGILRLTRVQEYLCFVVVTTLLGAAVGVACLAGHSSSSWLPIGWRWALLS